RSTKKYHYLYDIRPDHRLDPSHHRIKNTYDAHYGDQQVYVYARYRCDRRGGKEQHDAHPSQLIEDERQTAYHPNLVIEPLLQVLVRRGDTQSPKKGDVVLHDNRRNESNHHRSQRERPVGCIYQRRDGHKRDGAELCTVYTKPRRPPGDLTAGSEEIVCGLVLFVENEPDPHHHGKIDDQRRPIQPSEPRRLGKSEHTGRTLSGPDFTVDDHPAAIPLHRRNRYARRIGRKCSKVQIRVALDVIREQTPDETRKCRRIFMLCSLSIQSTGKEDMIVTDCRGRTRTRGYTARHVREPPP